GKGEGDVTVAVIYCRLPDLGGLYSTMTGKTRQWSQFQAMGMARQVLAQFPDVRSAAQLISNIGQAGRNADLQFNLTGPDLEKLNAYARENITALHPKKGIVDLDTTMANRKPELQVHIDRAKASSFGLRINDIASTLHVL